MMHSCNKGMSVLFIIGAVVLLSTVAAGIAVMSPSALNSNLSDNSHQQAYYLALSGVNVWKSNFSNLTAGQNYSYNVANGGKVKIYFTDNGDGTWSLSSTGVANANRGNESNFLIAGNYATPSGSSDSDLPPTGNVLSMAGESITSGRVDDASLHDNTGRVYGTFGWGWYSDPVEVVTGKVSNGLKFNCNQYGRVVFPDINEYDIFYSGTIMLWFYAYNFDHEYAGLVHKGTSTDSCISQDGSILIFTDEVYTLQFFQTSDGKNRLHFAIIDGDAYTGRCNRTWKHIPIYSNKTFSNSDRNKWYYVAVTWIYNATTNATKIIMYINGEVDKETDWTQPFKPRANNSALVVGSQQNSNRGDADTFFCGIIDEVNVYDYPLTAKQISKYYESTK